MYWLGRRRFLIGIGFDDGSSVAMAQSPEFGGAITRFFGPLFEPFQVRANLRTPPSQRAIDGEPT